MRSLAQILALSLILLASFSAAASEWWEVDLEDQRSWLFTVTSGGFVQALDGDLLFDDTVGDTPVDVESAFDLGVERDFSGRVDYQPFLKHHIRVGAVPMSFSGDNVLTSAITVGGSVFPAGNRVTSEMQLDHYELAYRYDSYLGDHFTLSPIVQLNLVDARLSANDVTSGFSTDENVLAPVPYLGMRAEAYPLSRLGLFAEGKGFTIGKQGSVYDVEGGAALTLMRSVLLTASYRFLSYDFEYDGAEIDAILRGPYLGMALRF